MTANRLRRRHHGRAFGQDEGRRHRLQYRSPFDHEIDVAGLKRTPGIRRLEVKPQVDRWVYPDGHEIILLAEGRLVNLGCAQGTPLLRHVRQFYESSPGPNRALEGSLFREARSAGPPPPPLDEEVARLHLDKLGASIGKLTKAQAEYLGLNIEGPFKGDNYRY